MFMRFISSSSVAMLVTAGLLLVMAGFVSQQSGPRLTTTRRAEFPPFVFEPPPPPTVIERTRPPEPDPVDDQPPRPLTGGTDVGIPVLNPSPGDVAPTSDFGGFGLGITDGDLLPIVTVAPNYPPSAAERGLEGYVTVVFTVAANGSVDNVRVVESTHKVFERAAVDAAYKFRFRPRVIGGEPVAVDGVRRRITFILED